MGQKGIRLLRASEIECRVASINAGGLSLLLYKDARVDQRILDETFGAFGWKRSHQCIDGNLYCTVEILDREFGEWVAKQDVGTTGYMEKEKSQASDSFKRACFNWGIGRELYTAPFIWIPADKAVIQRKDNKYCCNDRFHVASIDFNKDREISSLVIANEKGKTVYEMKLSATAKADKEMEKETGKQEGKTTEKATGRTSAQDKEANRKVTAKGGQGASLTEEQMASLQAELVRTGIAMETVQDRYRIQEPGDMGEELYHRVMSALKRTKPVEAA